MAEYSCEDCGKSFEKSQSYAAHRSNCLTDTYDDMGEYVCEDCGEEFDNPRSFAGHKTGCGNLEFDDKELLERLYHKEGLSTFQISDRFDADQTTVYYQLKKHGIETRSPGDGIRKRYEANLTVSMSKDRVQFFFDEFGETRSFLLSQLVALLDNAPSEVFGPGTHIHHKNGMPFDDRQENLEIVSADEHNALHGKEQSEWMPRDEDGDFVAVE